MGETELERLVVRLVGDPASFLKMLKDAQAAAQTAAKNVEDTSKKVEGFGKALQGFAGSTLKVLGALGIAASLRGAFDKYVEYERNINRLTAAIEVNGHAVTETLAEYRAFAKELSKVSMESTNSALNLFQMAEAMGLSGDAAERAVKDAVSLSAATGQSAEFLVRATSAMQQGNLMLLRRIPQLRGVRDETQLLAKAQRLITSGEASAAKEAAGAAGQLKKLGESFKGITLEVGGLVAKAVLPLVSGLRDLIDGFKSLGPEANKALVIFVALAGATLALPPLLTAVSAGFASLGVKLGALGAAVLAHPYIAAAAAIIGLVAILGKATYESTRAAAEDRKRNEMIEAQRQLTESQTAAIRQQGAAEMAAVAEIVIGYEKKQKALQDSIDKWNKEASATQEDIDSQKEYIDWAEKWLAEQKKLGQPDFTRWKEISEELATARRELDRLTKIQKEEKTNASNAAKEMEKLNDRLGDPKVKERIDKQRKELELHMATLGMDKDEAQLFKLEMVELAGAHDAAARKVVEEMRARLALSKALEENAKRAVSLRDQTKKMIEDLEMEKYLFENTTDAMGEWEKKIVKLQHELNLLNAETNKSEGTLKRIAEITANLARLKIEGPAADMRNKLKKMYEEGKNLTEEFATPQEKLAKRQRELSDLYYSGAISFDVYNKALGKYAEGLQKATDAIKDFTSAQGAEAKARVAAYTETLNRFGPTGLPAPTLPAGGVVPVNVPAGFGQTPTNLPVPQAVFPPGGGPGAKGVGGGDPEIKALLRQIARNTGSSFKVEPAGIM